MKKEDIHPFDWGRMFVGEVPFGFFVEVIFRTAFVYLILMVAMRLMGKKIASQLGRNEMIAIISMAAAIGVPLQSPDRGLLPAVIIAGIVVATQQFIASKTTKSEKFETITQDKMSVLVSESGLQLKQMSITRLTRERVFGQLRNLGYCQLGEVKRLYLEANGTFTVIKHERPQPGLCILPDWDQEYIGSQCSETEKMVCNHCGNLPSQPGFEIRKCSNCGKKKWVKAVIHKSS
jgi:uncharacterized membrane protein YcaP (DUF421 family)